MEGCPGIAKIGKGAMPCTALAGPHEPLTEHHAEVLEVPVITRRSKFMELEAHIAEHSHHCEVQEHSVSIAGGKDEEVIPIGSGKRSSRLKERDSPPVFHK